MKISTLASLVLLAAPLTAMADEQIPATAFTDWEYSTNHGPENVVDGDIDTYFETLKGCLKTIVNRSEFSERNNNSCDHEHFVG